MPFVPPKSDTVLSPSLADSPLSVPTVSDPNKLSERLEGGLKTYAPHFVSAGMKHGVDPSLLAAISMFETGRGTSKAFREKENAMGVSDDNGPISFSGSGGVPASIERMAQRIASDPIYEPARKAGTIEALGQIYSPVGANNDLNSTNSGWSDGVGRILEEIRNGKPATPTSQDVRLGLQATQSLTPDSAVKVDRLSKSMGLPVDLVMSKQKEFSEADEAEKIIQSSAASDQNGNPKNPITLKWLNNPINLAKAKDDVPSLTAIEEHAQGLRNKAFNPETMGDRVVGRAPHVFGSKRVTEQNQEIIEREGFFSNLFGSMDDMSKARDFGMFLTTNAHDDNAVIDRAVELRNMGRVESKPGVRSFLGNTLGGAVEPIGIGVGASFLTTPVGGAVAAGADMTFAGAGSAYQRVFNEQLDQGLTPQEAHQAALKAAGFGAVVNAALAATLPGSGKLATSISGLKEGIKPTIGQAVKFIGSDAAIQSTLGVTSTAATNLYEGRPTFEGSGESALSQALFSLIHLPMLSGTVSPESQQRVLDLQRTVKNAYETQGKIVETERSIQNLDKLNELVQNSKLTQRDPESIAELAEQSLKGNGQISTASIDAQRLNEVFFQSAKTQEDAQAAQSNLNKFAQDVGIAPENLNNAIKIGGDVQVSLPKFVAKYGKDPVFAAIKDDLRFGADGLSVKDVEAARGKLKELQEEIRSASGALELPVEIAHIRNQRCTSRILHCWIDSDRETTWRNLVRVF
jgi:hypothetical protein